MVGGLFIVACRLLSSCGTWPPEHAGSAVAACRLSCPVACGILVPWPGIKPTSPILEGRFLTIVPTGKSCVNLFLESLEVKALVNTVYAQERSIQYYLCWQKQNKTWKQPWITIIGRINLVNPFNEIVSSYFRGYIRFSLIYLGEGWVKKKKNQEMEKCTNTFSSSCILIFSSFCEQRKMWSYTYQLVQLIYLGSSKREWGSYIASKNLNWCIASREYFKKTFLEQ